MINKKRSFGKLLATLAFEKGKLAMLLVLSIGLALSEGLSVGLLVPILEANAETSAFAKIPVLNVLLKSIGDIPPDTRMLAVALLMAVAVLLRGLMQFGAQIVAALIPLGVQCRLMATIYDELVEADLGYMSGYNSGQLRNLLNEQPQRASTVVQSVASMIISLFIILLYGAFMLAISWEMTVAAAVFVIFGYALMKGLSGPWFAWSGERLTSTLARMHGIINETLIGLVLIKLRSAEQLAKVRFSDGIDQLRFVERKRYFFTELQNPVF
ncbi:ABC transporter transmembrane domain-containing protein, partial [Pseudomonadota bacterium]